MTDQIKRKMGAYYLELKKVEGRGEQRKKTLVAIDPLKSFFDQMLSEHGYGKKFRYGSSENRRQYWLDTITFDQQEYRIVIKSGRRNFRPDVANLDTLAERENPRGTKEADPECTHVVVRFDEENQRSHLAIEEYTEGMRAQAFVRVLARWYRDGALQEKTYKNGTTKQVKRHEIIDIEAMTACSFLEALGKLQRATQLKISANHKLLGGRFLALAERYKDSKADITLIASAESDRTLHEMTREIFGTMGEEGDSAAGAVNGLRVSGKTPEGNSLIFETDLVKLSTYGEFDTDGDKGTLKSDQVFRSLGALALQCEEKSKMPGTGPSHG